MVCITYPIDTCIVILMLQEWEWILAKKKQNFRIRFRYVFLPVNCCTSSLFSNIILWQLCIMLNCLGMIFYHKKGQNCIFLRQKILLSNSFEISLKKQCISFYTYSISGRICAILATFLMKNEQKFDLLTYWTKAS